jgi:preprotein translocase subunit SecG
MTFETNAMNNILTIAQIALSALLIAVVLLQQQGAGVGSAFGGEGNVFRTKRGVEKSLFYATIVLAALFMGVSIAAIMLAK